MRGVVAVNDLEATFIEETFMGTAYLFGKKGKQGKAWHLTFALNPLF